MHFPFVQLLYQNTVRKETKERKHKKKADKDKNSTLTLQLSKR